jgi:hypothetical protein
MRLWRIQIPLDTPNDFKGLTDLANPFLFATA